MRGRPLRVLVTRPEPGASATARRLVDAGVEPVTVPLTRIVPLPVEASVVGRVDAVAATSAAALRAAPAGLLTGLQAKPFFAVGVKTAEAAVARGFADVRTGGDDALALARLVLRSAEVRSVLFLCGRVRRPDFEAALRAAGIAVTAVETYDTVANEVDAALAALGAKPVDAVLLYSEAAALAFVSLRAKGSPVLGDAVVYALSPRILAAAGGTGLAAAAPNEDTLFALLGEWARERGEAAARAPAPFQPLSLC